MNTCLQPQKVGLTLGFLVGGLHLGWVLLIAFGFAQPLVDFVFWLHMIKSSHVVDAFNPFLAVGLVLLTFFIGYGIGFLFAMIWNRNQ